MTIDRPARTALAVLALTALLAACSKPQDTIIPTDKAEWDKTLAPAAKKLSEEERQLLGAYMARQTIVAGLGNLFGQGTPAAGIPPGMTIGQAIADQKAWAAEKARKEEQAATLKREAEAKAAAARKEIDGAVTVALLKHGFRPRNFQTGRISDQQTFVIAIKNTGSKPIAGVAGRMVFIDIFDKEVGAVGFQSTETIEPGQTYTWNGERDYNEFMQEHRAVRDLEAGKFKTRFEAESIVFTDGSSLKADS